ncbi:UNVERIFIED_CONTAM: Peroxidasin-like protein [Trichonephila clavipes]
MKTVDPDLGCIARPRNMYCFDAGDNRVNEQLQLAVMHVIMMREHNRLAEGLAHVNPHWDDETLYQEARHILSAEIQQVTYNEFLPIVLGHGIMKKYDLNPLNKGYYSGYSPKINAGIRAAFQASAYRFGHSLLPDVTERFNKFHEKIESIRLSRQLLQPYDLYKPGIVDTFILGLINQEAYRMDPAITTEVGSDIYI